MARERETGAEDGALPRLSAVTLAFLEACCRGSPAHEWRVRPCHFPRLSCDGDKECVNDGRVPGAVVEKPCASSEAPALLHEMDRTLLQRSP